MDGRKEPSKDIAIQTDPKPFINYHVKNGMRLFFDLAVLTLFFRVQKSITSSFNLSRYPWTTCLALAYLYCRSSDALNPFSNRARYNYSATVTTSDTDEEDDLSDTPSPINHSRRVRFFLPTTPQSTNHVSTQTQHKQQKHN